MEKSETIEVWFFSVPFSYLIKYKDWKGILLRSHIKWLGQTLTHCAIRVNIGELDVLYQATWNTLMSSDVNTVTYPPSKIVPIHNIDVCLVLEKLDELFSKRYTEPITLKNILLMMFRKPEQVDGMLCTSFVAECLNIPIEPMDLYPDALYRRVVKHESNQSSAMSEVQLKR